MVESSEFLNDSLRQSLIRHIVDNCDRAAVSHALVVSQKNKRLDAISGIIRDSARNAPIYMIGGEPHAYVPCEGVYRKFSWTMLGDVLYDVMRELGVKNGDFVKIDFIVRIVIRAMSTKEAEVNKTVVVMSNGVYDTVSHRLLPYDKGFIAVNKVDYPYVSDAVSSRWNVFLAEVLPNYEHRQLLQEALALAYIDRTKVKIEYLTILKGAGANGKSVVFNTMLKMVGDGSVSTFSISDLINSKREQNIAACNGKRINYCSEIRTSEISVSNADAFKALVSGEPIMARALYHEPFLANSIPVLFANANNLPKIVDPSMSIQRRMIIIPFDVHIPEDRQDAELSNYISEEISGVFNWVMQGLFRLQSNGYKLYIPLDIQKLVDSYVNEVGSVSKWLADKRYFPRWNPMCPKDPSKILAWDLYSMYQDWCAASFEETYPRTHFLKELTEKNFEKKRTCDGMQFFLFVARTEEEMRTIQLQEAISTSIRNGERDMEIKMLDDGTMRVRGINDTERYLALPHDSLLFLYRTGTLDGTFEFVDGQPSFEIHALQRKLSNINFYNTISKPNDHVRLQINGSKGSTARMFNRDMEMRGLPFYKFSGNVNYIPKDCVNKIRVPYDWEYSPDAAEILIREHMEKENQNNN